jgi:hypothetical protein
LPIPRDEWLSPRFHGVVLDADSGKPLKDVTVTLSDYGYAENETGPVTAVTDVDGKYAVLATKRATWLAIWIGPYEGPQKGTVTFKCAAYATAEEKRSMFGSAYARPDYEINIRLKRN